MGGNTREQTQCGLLGGEWHLGQHDIGAKGNGKKEHKFSNKQANMILEREFRKLYDETDLTGPVFIPHEWNILRKGEPSKISTDKKVHNDEEKFENKNAKRRKIENEGNPTTHRSHEETNMDEHRTIEKWMKFLKEEELPVIMIHNLTYESSNKKKKKNDNDYHNNSEFDILIIIPKKKVILEVECKTTVKGKNLAKQLQKHLEYIKTTNKLDDVWKYVTSVAVYDNPGDVRCNTCQPFIIEKEADLQTWWQNNIENKYEDKYSLDESKVLCGRLTCEALIMSTLPTQKSGKNKRIMKKLSKEPKNDPSKRLRSIAVTKTTKLTQESIGSKEEILLWTTEQHRALYEEPKTKRLIVIGDYGTGKTLLLVAKAKKIAEQNPKKKIMFVILGKAKILYEETVKNFQNNHRNVDVILSSGEENDIKTIVKSVKDNNNYVALFIDEAYNLAPQTETAGHSLKNLFDYVQSDSIFFCMSYRENSCIPEVQDFLKQNPGSKMKLCKNLRNTWNVENFVSVEYEKRFAPEQNGSNNLEEVSWKLQGPEPEKIEFRDKIDDGENLKNLIFDKIWEQLKERCLVETLAVICYPCPFLNLPEELYKDYEKKKEKLYKETSQNIRLHLVTESQSQSTEPSKRVKKFLRQVWFTNPQVAKGSEFGAVILVWPEEHSEDFNQKSAPTSFKNIALRCVTDLTVIYCPARFFHGPRLRSPQISECHETKENQGEED